MAWLPAIATLGGGIMQMFGQEDANDTNMAIQQNNSAFNATEAATNRQFNAEQAQDNRAFQESQAVKQMAFQQQNADTVWQRGTRDMLAAGLNPMLAYSQGGNPAPQGASGHGSAASGSAAQAGQPGNMQNTLAAAGASATQWAQVENIQADTDKKIAEADLTRHQSHTEKGRPSNVAADTERIRKQGELFVRQADLTDTQNKQAQAEIERIFASEKNINADTALKKVNEVLQRYDIPRMSAESIYFKTEIGRTSPHNKYGPQNPFRLLEGLGERVINRWSTK